MNDWCFLRLAGHHGGERHVRTACSHQCQQQQVAGGVCPWPPALVAASGNRLQTPATALEGWQAATAPRSRWQLRQ